MNVTFIRELQRIAKKPWGPLKIPFGVNWFILLHVMGPQKCHLEGLLWGKSFSHNYHTIGWYTYSADAVHPIHLAFFVSVPVIAHKESYCHGLVQDTLAKKTYTCLFSYAHSIKYFTGATATACQFNCIHACTYRSEMGNNTDFCTLKSHFILKWPFPSRGDQRRSVLTQVQKAEILLQKS